MKLMRDSTQKLPTATLLGVGITTNSDGGNSLSKPNKKMMFADDLRQQISEAVASNKSRLVQTSATESDVRTQNFAHTNSKPDVAEALGATYVATDTDINPQSNAVVTVAAGGSLLPPSASALPADSGLLSIEASVDFDIINPLADASHDLIEASAWVPQQKPFTPPVMHAPAPVNLYDPAMPTEAESVEADLVGINLTEKLSRSQAALTDYTSKKTTAHSVLDSVEPDQSDSELTLLGALDRVVTQPTASDSRISQFPANLTAAYDLSLPEVMPEGSFALADVDGVEVSTIPLLFTAQPQINAGNQEDIAASSTPPLPGSLLRTGSSTDTASLMNHTQSATAVDLLTKGAEPVSTTSNRSAYVNSLIASLLGNTPEILDSAALTPDVRGQNKLVSTAQATSAMNLLQGQADLLSPTKSLLSDKLLLANVADLTSEQSTTSQSASIYNADQRLQQAVEARQTHLQGMQTSSASADAAMSRASGTIMAAMDISFGQAGWAERIGRQILLQSAQGNSAAQIQLDPPELGSLVIKLQLVDQSATVNFASPHAMVRDALEQQVQRLQELFREQGMNLLDVSVSDQSANSRQDPQRQSAGNESSSDKLGDSSEQNSAVIVRQSNSLIDYYA